MERECHQQFGCKIPVAMYSMKLRLQRENLKGPDNNILTFLGFLNNNWLIFCE